MRQSLDLWVVAEFAVKALLSYLLGSVVGSLLIGKLRGVDIRRLGSGNAGGTNALRTQGKVFAFWVMVIDIGKGWLATGILARLIIPGVSYRSGAIVFMVPPGATDADVRYYGRLALQRIDHWGLAVVPPHAWLGVVCGIAAILGHVYPIFYGFRGGKGVATLLGVVLGLNSWLLVPMLVTWLLAVLLFGFVGLASILATLALAAAAVMGMLGPHLPWPAFYVLTAVGVFGLQWPLFTFGVVAALLIAFTHRPNIARMFAGTEPRALRLWLFRPRSRGV